MHIAICEVTSYEGAVMHVIKHYGALSCMSEQSVMELQKRKRKKIYQPEALHLIAFSNDFLF